MKDVTVEQVLVAQCELEQAVYKATASTLETFRSKTGLTPRSVSVSLYEETKLGSLARQYAVGEVLAEISLPGARGGVWR